MIERLFVFVQGLLSRPVFWALVVGGLIGALLMNIISGNRFDPGMAYSNFLQNWVQVLALAITSVTSCAVLQSVRDLHEKHDDTHAQAASAAQHAKQTHALLDAVGKKAMRAQDTKYEG